MAADPDAVLADPGAAVRAAEVAVRTVGPAVRAVGAAVELPPQPRIVVATADSAILGRCTAWFNLAREVVARHVPAAWVIPLDA